jgi:hypothetical protein
MGSEATNPQKRAARKVWNVVVGDDAAFEKFWAAVEQEAGTAPARQVEVTEREAAEARAYMRRMA